MRSETESSVLLSHQIARPAAKASRAWPDQSQSIEGAVVCFAGRNHGRSGIAMPAAFSLFVFSFLWIEMSLLGQACVYLHKIYCSWFKKKPSTICQARYITECPFKDHIRWNEISTLFKRYTKVKLVCERFLRFMASACVWFNLEIAPDTWGLARAGRQPKLFQMLPAAED